MARGPGREQSYQGGDRPGRQKQQRAQGGGGGSGSSTPPGPKFVPSAKPEKGRDSAPSSDDYQVPPKYSEPPAREAPKPEPPKEERPEDKIVRQANEAKKIITDRLRKFAGKVGKIADDITAKKNEMASLTNAANKFKETLKKTKDVLGELTNSINTRLGQNGKLKDAIRGLKGKLKDLGAQFTDNDKKLKNDQTRKKKLTEMTENLTDRVSKIENEIEKDDGEVSDLAKKFDNLQGEIKKGQNGIKQVDGIVKDSLAKLLDDQNEKLFNSEPIQAPSKIPGQDSVISVEVQC